MTHGGCTWPGDCKSQGAGSKSSEPWGLAECDIRIPADLLLLRILKCSKGMKGKVRPRDKPRRTPQSATPSTHPVVARAGSGDQTGTVLWSLPLGRRWGREAGEDAGRRKTQRGGWRGRREEEGTGAEVKVSCLGQGESLTMTPTFQGSVS